MTCLGSLVSLLFPTDNSRHYSCVPVNQIGARGVIRTVLLLLVSLSAGWGQSGPLFGVQPWSTQMVDSFSSIDLATGNIFVNVPVRSKAGKIPFSFGLSFNSVAYESCLTNGVGYTWIVAPMPQSACAEVSYFYPVGEPSFQAGVGYTSSFLTKSCSGNSYQVTVENDFYIVDGTGAPHAVPVGNPNGSGNQDVLMYHDPCPGALISFVATTTDGSGYTLVASTTSPWIVYDKHGNNITPFVITSGYYLPLSTQIQDPDGSKVTLTGNEQTGPLTYTDTLASSAGVNPPLVVENPDGGPYQYTDASGNTQTFQVNNSSYMQQTAFGCSGINDISPTQVSLPSSVTIPTGTVSVFYETTPGDTHTPHYITGRLAGITYPTGGGVSYAYSGGNNNTGISCEPVFVPTLTRTVFDNNGNQNTWTYVSNKSLSSLNFNVIETDPAGNQTVYNFGNEYQTQEAKYQGGCPGSVAAGCAGGGSALLTTTTCYNGVFTSCATANPVPPFLQTDVYSQPGSSSPSLVETTYDAYGNVTNSSKYGFGATYPPSSGPAPISTTTFAYDYPATAGGSYPCGTLAIAYMYDRPCSATILDSSGATESLTNYTYNSTGHPITTSKWVSGTGPTAKYLNSSVSYNANGTVSVATDANTTTTTYNYSSSVCNSIIPTGVTIKGTGVNLSRSMAWDCNGGVQTSLTDENKQITTTKFTNNGAADPFYRPLSKTL